MKDSEQAIQKNKQEFNSLISEYRGIIGTKNVNSYTQNYTEIIKKGESLK